MKALLTGILLGLLNTCSPSPEGAVAGDALEAAQSECTGSFKLANIEIREETLLLLIDAGIEYWIGDDGTINYNLADGEAIDRIGNDVILAYIRRN